MGKLSELEPFPQVDPTRVAAFVARVGDRVRTVRKRRAISRRVLSERSGVSQRYLAQLEAGTGNVSIALLYQISAALQVQVGNLIEEDEAQAGDFHRFAELFRSATRERQKSAIEQLQPADGCGKASRICLIGLRGAGKSTLGAKLAAELGSEFQELNQWVEEQSGMPVGELIALYGQEGFRQLEKRALDRVLDTKTSVVLAVGGGIVSEQSTYDLLLERFHTIWLKAQPEEHMERVRAQGDDRPMAGNPMAMDELRSILTDRESLYSRADGTVDTSGQKPHESLRKLIVEAIRVLQG